MGEKDKMLNGDLYSPESDETLIRERLSCKKLCFEFNHTPIENVQDRKNLLREIFGSTKDNFQVEQPLQCDYGYNVSIGNNFYSNHNLVILDCAKVEFGDNVFLGPNCAFYTPEHPLDAETRNKGLEYARPIRVGNNVWIGGSVTVLSGVTIGDNCVIGAGSVVVKDIPANSVAVGNPCNVIKSI